MSAPDLSHLTATQAARDLRAGRYSAEQLALACQARIDRFNPTLNALVTPNREGALLAAREADRRLARGDAAPALLGVPVSVKDAFATRDMLTTSSHRPLAAYFPSADATVVARWREAGAVLMGKSNLPELGGPGRSVWHMLAFGVLARSVEDLHLGYSLLAGPDQVDWSVPPFPAEPLSVPATADRAAPMRVAVWDDFAGTPLCPRTRRGLENLTGKLSAAGHEVVRCAPPDFDVRAAWETFGLIGGAEIGLGMPGWQRRLFLALRYLLPRNHVITRAVAGGMRFDLRRYNQALNQREALIQSLERFLGEWDAVICPVAATGPYPGEPMPPTRKPPRLKVGEATLPYLEATIPMTAPFSLTGSPVLSLPVSVEAGLPVGVQVIGKRWQEHALLETGLWLESVLGGFVPPPLAE